MDDDGHDQHEDRDARHDGDRRRIGLAPRASDEPVPVPAAEPRLRELIGEVLREHRRDRGDRLVDVADRAGVSAQYLSEVERGVKDPSSEVVAAIAAAVGLDLDGLLVELARSRGLVVEPRSLPPASVVVTMPSSVVGPVATTPTCLAA